MNYHRDWYVKDGAEKHKKELYQTPQGDWRLTTQEKKRILLNNIHGVDIDAQAVEVTKLSLLLKVLEGESDETLKRQLSFVKERALPDLGQNIKCGNSLIGTDYFTGKMFPDEEEMRRINPFDWQAGFPEIVKAGGFDAVIGNPPYVRIQVMKEWAPVEVEAYKSLYESASKGNYDIYVVFVERGLSLLNKNGRLGFILPHKFFQTQYGEPLRKLISKGKHLAAVVHFGDQQVFEGATTYTCLLFLDKGGSESCRFKRVEDLGAWQTTGRAIEGSIPVKNVTSAEWNFTVGAGASLFEKLKRMTIQLGDVADVFVGLQTSADDVFILDLVREQDRVLALKSKVLNKVVVLERDLLYPLISGTDVARYSPLPERQYILFPYRVQDESAELLTFERITKECFKTATYLLKTKKRLEQREGGKFKGSAWYRFGRNQNVGIQARVKLCVPRLVERLHATYDIQGNHFLDNVDVGGITLKDEYSVQGLQYLLGLLNSKLLCWFFPQISVPFRGGWYSANRQFLSKLPIRLIDFSDKSEIVEHDKIVSFVERMLDLHKRLAATKNPNDQTRLQSQIDATDREIDRLVYDLYGLTDDEIAIVEGSAKT